MYAQEIDKLAITLAELIKDKVPYEKTHFGKIKINPSDLQSHGREIANACCAAPGAEVHNVEMPAMP